MCKYLLTFVLSGSEQQQSRNSVHSDIIKSSFFSWWTTWTNSRTCHVHYQPLPAPASPLLTISSTVMKISKHLPFTACSHTGSLRFHLTSLLTRSQSKYRTRWTDEGHQRSIQTSRWILSAAPRYFTQNNKCQVVQTEKSIRVLLVGHHDCPRIYHPPNSCGWWLTVCVLYNWKWLFQLLNGQFEGLPPSGDQ